MHCQRARKSPSRDEGRSRSHRSKYPLLIDIYKHFLDHTQEDVPEVALVLVLVPALVLQEEEAAEDRTAPALVPETEMIEESTKVVLLLEDTLVDHLHQKSLHHHNQFVTIKCTSYVTFNSIILALTSKFKNHYNGSVGIIICCLNS
jgi:hypothetical protein